MSANNTGASQATTLQVQNTENINPDEPSPKSIQDEVREEDLVTILIHLKHTIVEEGQNVYLQVRVGGVDPISTWFKNGKKIIQDDRIHLVIDNDWHKLELNRASSSFDDEGLYTVICQNRKSYAKSQCTLYFEMSRQTGETAYPSYRGALYLPPFRLSVTNHLSNLRLNVGEPIKLRANFWSSPSDEIKYSWFKNNIPLSTYRGQHVVLNNEGNFSELFIGNATVNNTGVYTVVAHTTDGIVSSTSEVLVMDINFSGLLCKDNPGFIELLKDESNAYEYEDIRLVCKINNDEYVEISWLKDDEILYETNKQIFEAYGGHAIGLRLLNLHINDMGQYSIEIKKKDETESKIKVSRCDCFLSVSRFPDVFVPRTPIKKHLKTVVTHIGGNVCFSCSFDVKKKYFYAVWYIGLFKVERSTPQFQLVANGGNYLLYIKHVEPDMLGEVTCQLRRAIPAQKSLLSNVTTSYLIQVPKCVIHSHILCQNTELRSEKIYIETDNETCAVMWSGGRGSGKAFDETNGLQNQLKELSVNQDVAVAVKETTKNILKEKDDIGFKWYEKEMICVKEGDKSGEAALLGGIENETNAKGSPNDHQPENLFEILYCRLNDNGPNIATITNFFKKESSFNILIYECNEASNQPATSVILKWERNNCLPSDTWYAIQLMQSDGQYYVVGETSQPYFKIQSPISKKIMFFRIKTISPIGNVIDANVVVVPTGDLGESALPQSIEQLSTEYFYDRYAKTEVVLGSGAFGKVILVQNVYGELFAAKEIKTKIQNRRDQADREFQLLKKLRHPKIVQLYGGFQCRNLFIIVMDYLWGGELFERIVEEEYFEEAIAVVYIQQILEGLQYLHQLAIAHLDLKPENVVCIHPNSRKIKIVDFGLSRELAGQEIRAMYGTRDFIPPEALAYEPLTTSCDMWSLGVMTYVMLSGTAPFAGETFPDRAANITKANFNYDDPTFLTLSDQARSFIDSLLLKNPKNRLTAVQALNHPWVVEGPSTSVKIGLIKHWRTNLRFYLATNKARWQRAGNVVIAANRLRTGLTTQRNSSCSFSTEHVQGPHISNEYLLEDFDQAADIDLNV